MKGIHVKKEIRSDVVSTLERIKKKTGLPTKKLSENIGINYNKISEWKKTKPFKDKKIIPKSHWSTPEERKAVIDFKRENMLIGYVRLTWMMVDRNVAYLSPSSVYRILVEAAMNNKWTKPAGEPKKEGFEQPRKVHEHWHIDISYINFHGTFVYLICVLDGYSRAILAWDIRARMESFDAQIVLWRACDNWLTDEISINPRLISDNGSQFLTKDFKSVLNTFALSHVRTSVNHPQSNGKLERFHGTIKSEKIREMPKFTLEQMKNEIEKWIYFYNNERLHSSLDYVTPMDVMEGRKEAILHERKQKMLAGKQKRKEYSVRMKDEFKVEMPVLA